MILSADGDQNFLALLLAVLDIIGNVFAVVMDVISWQEGGASGSEIRGGPFAVVAVIWESIHKTDRNNVDGRLIAVVPQALLLIGRTLTPIGDNRRGIRDCSFL